MDFSVESLRPGDDEQRHRLGRQAFGGTMPFDPDMPTLEPERVVAAYDDDQLLGTVVTLDFEMWWSGTSVPCGGVSGVTVRPEARGRGVAKALLAESFARMQGRGEVLSALYPTTATLYRSQGFEIIGTYPWRRVPLSLVPRAAAGALAWREVAFDDRAIRSIHESMSSEMDGWFHTPDSWWARAARMWGGDERTNRYAYVGARDGSDVAAVVYRYEKSDARMYELGVDLLAGVDHDAVEGALGFLAENGTTATYFETTLPTTLLALHVPNLQHTTLRSDWPWMLRLVDVAAAFEVRPVPRAVRGEVSLHVEDPVVARNDGPVMLTFVDGKARVAPGGDGRVRVAVSDLAVVYGGGDVGLLHRAGRLVGATEADIDLLRAACAASPTMPFFF